MLKPINHLKDEDAEKRALQDLSMFYEEVRQILPGLPNDIQIYFDDFCMVDGQGCGGFAYSPDTITIAYDPDFKDKKFQRASLRDTMFHEAYHVAQGYTGAIEAINPLEVATYEGAAIVFERDVAKSRENYGSDDESLMRKWYFQLAELPNDYDWYAWKVFDESDGESAKSYRVGRHIVDKAISNSNRLSIVNLNKMNAKEIIQLADISD